MRHPAGFEAASGDHLLPVTHLDGEGVGVPLQDDVGAVVERQQGRHVAVPEDKDVGGGQELGWQLCRRHAVGGGVKPAVNDFGSAECHFHLF